MADLIAGQVETMLPALLAAMAAEKAAKAEADRLKAQMVAIIGKPQTVRTVWGSVTLNRGRRTVKVTDKALEAEIKYLKESGIASGKCEESYGSDFISVKATDR
jgi:hypothetical protein